MKMEIPATTDVEMPRTSSIYKETVVTPAKSMFSSSETGTPLQSVATTAVTLTKVSEQSFLSQIPFLYWRTSSANDTFSGLDADETGTPLQTMDAELESMTLERSNKPSEPVPPPPTKGSTRRQGARVFLVPVDASAASTARQPNGASSGIPLKAAARPPPAEAIPEEEEDDGSKVGPPQPKRQKIEGNGIRADDQADPLAGMTFDSMLDQKFFMQLKEKFTKLRPEVVSTMKASIFKMLDEAADS
ncbi:hypothetical protein HPB50_018177 [Hyalomma asiaticum]|uniref:Uncharacterized protein n=1 Tax=Hyalomma asiaticum TaxID=266040 RepID=A0ACB7S3Y2_HYAAI|nr:hypothetical protein HPB50_018177 [Hyalomma asiaticum]